tara:strand:- start:3031 stop:3225 length:195 start_codon:yes stop_codon:yes gene_type:complete
MAYRFNNGRGAVTCDKCDIIYDEDLSYLEYEDTHRNGKGPYDKDYCCWHKDGKDYIETDKEDNE